MVDLQDGMPPGWDAKTDYKTGKQYFVNHYTKTTTWEDPRNKHRYHHATPVHVAPAMEYIPLQGSPDLRRNYIYPSHPSPIPAFQMPGQYSPKFIPLQEMRSSSRMSPLSIRTARIQDSSLTNVPDTDDSVAKISSMFPTVSDTHIRLLLKKYHGREAVVISALQVEKHPISTPGPFATPPPTRTHMPLQMTPPPLGVRTASSRNSSPVLRTASGTNTSSTYTGSPSFRNNCSSASPRPHSSPKLKLRYMKSIFPQAEETAILEILTNNENNIQKTSEILKDMGFDKKDTIKLYQLAVEAKAISDKAKEEELAKPATPLAPPRIITSEEKDKIQSNLQMKYKDIPEHVIHIALDSVHYEADRANQILEIMVHEDNKMREAMEKSEIIEIVGKSEVDYLSVPNVPTSQSRQSLKSLLKEKCDNKEKISFSRVIEENNLTNLDFKSLNISNTIGSNPGFAKGANEKLLLEDYVKWQGPNPIFFAEIAKKESLAKGPNKSLLMRNSYTTFGPNSDLRKGPKFGLAKGSIFSQMKEIVVGESRGK